MYTLQNLEVTRIIPRHDGIFVYAKYPEWHKEYTFVIASDGQIKGQADSGFWLGLSDELSNFVAQLFNRALADHWELVEN